uniref:Rho-GAP domain-containing protein n=1 Tax=Mesocestoides corti TaxID=53468 RepID=A0A5K3EQE7_MESCO
MKQSFLSKFTRSLGYAPEGWPADDVAEIDAAASELKKITSDVVKKLSLYLPQTSLHNVRSLDLNYFSSESLQSSFTFGIPNDPLLNKIVKPIESRQKRCNIPQNTNDLNGAVNGLKSPENEVIEGGFCMANDVSSTSLMPKEQIKCEDSIESRFLGNCNSLNALRVCACGLMGASLIKLMIRGRTDCLEITYLADESLVPPSQGFVTVLT